MKQIEKNQMENKLLLVGIFLILTSLMSTAARAEWTIDLSRRSQQMRKKELDPNYTNRAPASVRQYDGEAPPESPFRSEVGTLKTLDGSVDAPVVRTRPESSFIDRIFDPGEPSQDIVILNTERGFVPNTIRVRKDGHYMVHVVNVNEKEKNVSFILDGFSEHHATYFGKVKSFKLEPRKEGIYSFLSPESAVEGRFIVYSSSPTVRAPATAQTSTVPLSQLGE